VETAAGSLKQNGYFQPAQAFAVYVGEERYPMAGAWRPAGVREGRTHNAWPPLTGKRDTPRRTDCPLSRSTLPMFISQVACVLDPSRLPRRHDQRPFSHGRTRRAQMAAAGTVLFGAEGLPGASGSSPPPFCGGISASAAPSVRQTAAKAPAWWTFFGHFQVVPGRRRRGRVAAVAKGR
jgi:hypothetical protein